MWLPIWVGLKVSAEPSHLIYISVPSSPLFLLQPFLHVSTPSFLLHHQPRSGTWGSPLLVPPWTRPSICSRSHWCLWYSHPGQGCPPAGPLPSSSVRCWWLIPSPAEPTLLMGSWHILSSGICFSFPLSPLAPLRGAGVWQQIPSPPLLSRRESCLGGGGVMP